MAEQVERRVNVLVFIEISAVVCDQPSRWNVHGALELLSRQLRLTLNVLGEHIEDLPYMGRLPS